MTVTGEFQNASGGGGFPDAQTGNQGNQLGQQWKSPNFVTGVSGWIIRRDGSVEFNNGVFRGTVTGGAFIGPDFEIQPNGMFLYSGPPALGNLVISIVPPGTVTDRFGNVVVPDAITVYGAAGQQVSMGLSAGVSRIVFPSGSATEGQSSELASALVGSGLAEFITIAFDGPATNLVGNTDVVTVQLNSANFGGTSFANGILRYIDPNNNVIDAAHWDANGFTITKGPIITNGPGQVTSDTTQRNATTGGTIFQITPSYSIPANTMVQGSIFELEVWFAGKQAVGAATTLEFFFQLGSANTALTLPAGFCPLNTNFTGHAKLTLGTRLPGVANVAQVFINGEVLISATTFALANSVSMSVSSPNAQTNANIDTTISQLCAISVEWGATASLGGLYSMFRRLV